MLAEASSLTMNYLIEDAHPDLWRLCFSRQEVVSAFKTLRQLKADQAERLNQSAAQFRKTYFTEPSPNLWANYLSAKIEEFHYVS